MRNIKVTCPISCCADVTSTFSAVFKAGVLRCKAFVFRWLSQRDYLAIYMLSGAYTPALARRHSERWRIVKTSRERMLKQGRKIAIFGNGKKFIVPLQTEMKGLELKEMTKNGNNNHAEEGKGQKLI